MWSGVGLPWPPHAARARLLRRSDVSFVEILFLLLIFFVILFIIINGSAMFMCRWNNLKLS